MENQKIRVSRGITVEVNDAGETIVIDVEDQMFVNKFYDLMNDLEQTAKDVDSDATRKLSDRDRLKVMIDHTRSIMAHMDDLFGEGCCRKVFGDTVPSPYRLADFFDQIRPIMERYMNDRQKEIARKYTDRRKHV